MNYSNNPAFNLEIYINKKSEFFEILNSFKKRKQKFEKTIDKKYSIINNSNDTYYVEVISKDSPFKNIKINYDYLVKFLKLYLYDLISEDDLYFKIITKYYNDDQIYYVDTFNVYFDFEFYKNNILIDKSNLNKKEIIHDIEIEKITFKIKTKKIIKNNIKSKSNFIN
ncbi:hypothetical protein [Marinitoga litoralis]|uniref:hypothetical protein n=1 Tax=Marinitoga litoralis TaxID=570855 RepID=UPI0019607822|nr:hypothetical protein [Marinitoga litoralis]MBM7559905.1 hypothetical protein [Marinitoga litoralis]